MLLVVSGDHDAGIRTPCHADEDGLRPSVAGMRGTEAATNIARPPANLNIVNPGSAPEGRDPIHLDDG